MKFLYLSFVLPPQAGAEPRHNVSVLRRLHAKGFEPLVVTGPRDFAEADDPALEALLPQGLTTTRVAWPRFRTNRYLAKVRQLAGVPVNPLEFGGAGCLYQQAARLVRDHRPAFLYTVHGIGAAHLAGLRLQRSTGLPWVAEFRDPWWHNATAWRYLGDHAARWWLAWCRARTRRLTRQVVTAADLVVVESPLHGDLLVREFGVDPQRIVAFGMGYEPDYFTDIEPATVEFSQRPVIGFVGTVYHGHDEVVASFVDALARLERRGHRFTLLTVGDPASIFGRHARRAGLTSYLPIGHVPLATALGLMHSIDYGFVCRVPEDVANINSKLWEYLAADRPILGAVPADGAMARLIRDGDCGIVLPYDTDGMVQALEPELTAYANGSRRRPRPGFAADYSAARMIDALAERLTALVGTGTGADSGRG